MMYIVVEIDNEDLEMTWHKGEPLLIPDDADIKEVQADGDELLYIVKAFINLPYSNNKRIQRWFGDMAKFIVANLP